MSDNNNKPHEDMAAAAAASRYSRAGLFFRSYPANNNMNNSTQDLVFQAERVLL